jgi:SAM-dependent methyltransferase
MLANARANLDRRLPIIRPCAAHENILSVAAGGPSLADTWQDLKGVTVAVNGSLQFLLDRGVKPWGVAVMDPGPHMKDIVPRVEGVHYFIASVCDPSLFDHLAGMDVGIWHPGGAPGLREVLDEQRGNNWTMVSGASTMGVRWLNLGYTLGFRAFEFHGLDSSYRGDLTHAYPDHTDGSDHLVIDGYHTKLAFVRQVSDFFAIMDAFSEKAVEPITIELLGDGWLQERWKAFREMHPQAFKLKQATEAEERDKYERMWRVDEYRGNSPGEQLVDVAISELGMKPGESVIDFGCGPGRATQRLKNLGFDVLGIDIAENSRDKGIDVPFRLGCLWDLPDDIAPADWGLCCDVMEHIPPEKVGSVLQNIRAKTKRGVLFNIAFFHDGFGNVIGERLHLTVQPREWWLDRLKVFWPNTVVIEADDRLPRAVFRAC